MEEIKVCQRVYVLMKPWGEYGVKRLSGRFLLGLRARSSDGDDDDDEQE